MIRRRPRMDDDDKTQLLKTAFGDSSDGEDLIDPTDTDRSPISWERVEAVNGLWLCANFLSPHYQSSLVSAILNEGWFVEASHNQAMRFGDLPLWATELSKSIREAVESVDSGIVNSWDRELSVLPADLLWRQPLFDQLIVNLYQPAEGICAHVDLMRFEDGIAIVSLESSCVMHFSRAGGEEEAATAAAGTGEKVAVYLNPGSLILMSGEARYLWKHEINRKPGFQVWDGQELEQKRRISVTLRKLCPSD